MSVVFVVGSEDALTSGTPWCKRFAEHTSTDIHVAVIGTESKVLLEHAKSSLAAHLTSAGQEYSIQAVEQDPNAVLEFIRQVNGKTLLLLHGTGGGDFEQKIFEKSSARTIWLRAMNPPPQTSDQVFIALGEDRLLPTAASESLLGLIPGQILCESTYEKADGEQLLADLRREMAAHQHDAGDLILFGIQDTARSNPAYAAALSLFNSNEPASIALVRSGEPFLHAFSWRIKRWASTIAPPMEREERLTLAKDLEAGSEPNLEFVGLISAAAMLAAFGLLQDSAAVIIGAMLIAPLMTPILGVGLALTHGNRPLFRTALTTIALGFVSALVASMLFGWLVWLVHPPEPDRIKWITGEMWARSRPSPLDFCVGLVGGLAAAYARTRTYLSSALAGAAIAAALVPPISTAGLQLAFGFWGQHEKGNMVAGPLLLVTINVLTIMVGASFILWARGMRSDRKLDARERWVPRVILVLLVLISLILLSVVRPEIILPG
jgi:uncharacterized hydrophobic protein (TIGR00271 family)